VLRGQPAPQRVPSAEPAARSVCTALTSQNYAALYDLLSAEQRASGTAAQFAASQRQLDIAEGPAQQCEVAVISSNGGQATMTFTVTRKAKTTHAGAARMTYEQGAWRLDTYDAQLI
jgi:hypothetical protein